MAEFAEALKKSLAGISDAYRAALSDLEVEVAYASQQVSEVAPGKVKLGLEELHEDEDGCILALVMTGSRDLHQDVSAFKIGSEGYPIRSGMTDRPGPSKWSFIPDTYLKDRAQIRQFLTRLASDRNSPLVRKLAFVLRKG